MHVASLLCSHDHIQSTMSQYHALLLAHTRNLALYLHVAKIKFRSLENSLYGFIFCKQMVVLLLVLTLWIQLHILYYNQSESLYSGQISIISCARHLMFSEVHYFIIKASSGLEEFMVHCPVLLHSVCMSPCLWRERGFINTIAFSHQTRAFHRVCGWTE